MLNNIKILKNNILYFIKMYKLICLIVVILTLFSCMISGDVFIKYIAFNSESLTCSNIVPMPTYIQQFSTTLSNKNDKTVVETAVASYAASAKTAAEGAVSALALANLAKSRAQTANTVTQEYVNKYANASDSDKPEILKNATAYSVISANNATYAANASANAELAFSSANNAVTAITTVISGVTPSFTIDYVKNATDDMTIAKTSSIATKASFLEAVASANAASFAVSGLAKATTPTTPITTRAATWYKTASAPEQTIANTLNTCTNISTVELNFAQFRIIINWLAFVIITFILFFAIKDYRKSHLYSSIISIILSLLLWIIMLVGGILMSMFAFNASLNKCNNKEYYCYYLSNNSLIFAKMYSVLSFFITFIINIGLIYYMASKL